MAERHVCQTAVLGAGLSGLAAAVLLQERGHDILVLEARERPGGRIDSVRDGANNHLADLGPSWVWPEYQPTVARWLDRLGIATFDQYEIGDGLLDFEIDAKPRRQVLPGQAGIVRIEGGPQSLVNALSDLVAPDVMRFGARVERIEEGPGGLSIQTPELTVEAQTVVCAIPPRIAADVDWAGLLDQDMLAEMRATPTWMAAQAKAVAVYDEPFWRAEGLSGRVVSRIGPMAEIHDHCGADGTPAALFGFVGLPHAARKGRGEELERAFIDQLVRCFGDRAAQPLAVEIRDWADEPETSTRADVEGPMQHPDVRPPSLRELHASGRIALAGAECATVGPGLIEGALAAAERAAAALGKA